MENKLFKNILVFLLAIQAIFALYFVFLAATDFPGMMGQFGVKYQPDMPILKFIIIYNAFISLSICLLSIFWIRKGNVAGIQTSTVLGGLLIVLSLTVFFVFNRLDILIVDTPRAILMVVFGVLAYRESKKLIKA